MERADHFICCGMDRIQAGIAQVNDEGVLLIQCPGIRPSAIRFLNCIAAKVINQDLCGSILGFIRRKNRLIGILVIGAQIQNILDVPDFRLPGRQCQNEIDDGYAQGKNGNNQSDGSDLFLLFAHLSVVFVCP